ncbi:MAG: AAA family ATPase [Polyangia bacterium]
MIELSNYVFHSKVHEGTDTALYEGYRTADRLSVVGKMLRSPYPSPRELARLRHEYSILVDLAGVQGVPMPLALERHGNGLILITESVNGRPLNEVMREHPLGLKVSLQIAHRLAEILEELHTKRVIHKDIKPHNILFDEKSGQVHLIDFGIAARLSYEVQKLVNAQALEGSLAYMSPEQTGRMNRVIDHRTDFYSLGITLYEMLVGQLPFFTQDPTEMIHCHVARTPVSPQQLASQVPPVVSNLVMKLLSKPAENRYQTARGLKADLARCMERLAQSDRIQDFALGAYDRDTELRMPQRLYGREKQLGTLQAAFERASRGESLLVMVSGHSGIGKSALVHEIHKDIARRGGYFIAGKFDQFNRSTPYAPLAQAFGELLRQILTESESAVAQWRQRLLSALGTSGKVLIDLIPELQALIGTQPEPPRLGPSETQNRFQLLVQEFVRVFDQSGQPLVLFLDDLQWADQESLKLLRVLLTAPQGGHLLVIGAYRDNEVDVAHPLMLALDDLRKGNARTESIVLEPLDQASVVSMIAEMTGEPLTYVRPLGEVVYQKTLGNPFFVGQFVTALQTDGLLAFDKEAGTWNWSVIDIRQKMETANVISVMVDRIARLPESTQAILKLAACIGHQFELQTLAVISERTPAEVAQRLWGAMTPDNLIIPLDSEYRFVHESGQGGSAEASMWNVAYRFIHDRVQQAAYSLISEAERPALHLRIGRLLLQRRREADDELLLFDIVNHLNLGRALIPEGVERWQLAELDLKAGQRARVSTAYAAAADYFQLGISLLGESDWQQHPENCFELYSGAAECDCLNARFDRLGPWIEVLLSHVRSQRERALVHRLRIQAYSARGDFAAAVQVGLGALAELGVTFPTEPAALQAQFMAEVEQNAAALGSRRIADLVDAPVLTDEHQQLIADLLKSTLDPAYLVNPLLYSVVTLKLVNIGLRYGHTPDTASAYAAHGFMLSSLFGRVEDGYQFGQVALLLNEKFGNSNLTCRLHITVAPYLSLCKPLREAFPHYERGCQAGIATGDFTNASYGYYLDIIDRFCAGEELGTLKKSIDKALLIMKRTREPISTVQIQLARQFMAALLGETRELRTLDSATFNEREFLAQLHKDRLTLPLYWHGLIGAQLCYLAGDYPGVLSAVQGALDAGASQMGVLYTIELSFYLCLALLALRDEDEESPQRTAREALLTTHMENIARWAERCPPNFRHKKLLLDAESARTAGRLVEAEELYEQAIAAAREQEFVHHVAIANELAARHYLKRDRKTPARAYMIEAHYAYTLWGATAKITALLSQFPGLLAGTLADPQTATRHITASATTSSRLLTGGLVDVASVLRASQTLSSEIVLEKLLEQLMRITVTSAGAERGVLLLYQQQRLIINATITVHPESIQIGLMVPLDESMDVPASAVRYAARTGEPVVVGNAEQDNRYARDPYIVARRTRSMMCLPLKHQGRITGVLYLENNVSQDAFTAERIELLRLLSTQAAIALENAMLYGSVQTTTQELRQSNRELGDANARLLSMTDELRRSNHEITEARHRVEVELNERVRAEQARAALQEEIIQLQNARLAEMSTPLIPITKQIMVMPLIGTMDNSRASQMLETALNGVQQNRAEVVILDITGMKQVDTSIAAMILQTAGAVRLLGAQVILTGIRAEIAQTLVGLGVDLSNVVTRGTLQGGIAYALSRTGQSELLRPEGARDRARSK